MASIVIEHFDPPATPREMRAYGDARARASEFLGGRTVWCATALPHGRRHASELGARVDGTGPGVASAPLTFSAGERLRRLAERLDGMLAGLLPRGSDLGPDEEQLCAACVQDGDTLVGRAVGAEDVVVVHDALSALLARALRERGAHTVWRVQVTEHPVAAEREALEFLRRFTPGIDAYILTWVERGPRDAVVERVAAAMPSAGVVVAKEFPLGAASDEPERLAWRTTLAEVVRGDRGERVGGTLHARPSVAAR